MLGLFIGKRLVDSFNREVGTKGVKLGQWNWSTANRLAHSANLFFRQYSGRHEMLRNFGDQEKIDDVIDQLVNTVRSKHESGMEFPSREEADLFPEHGGESGGDREEQGDCEDGQGYASGDSEQSL